MKIEPKVKKDTLIKKEAQYFIPRNQVPNGYVVLTIKEHTLIPSAGIDESNGNGYYVLWPKDVNKLLKEIHAYITKKHHVKKLAVISTDSHTIPLRYGVLGISTGFYGLEPLYDYRGKRDIFGRKLKFTKSNIVDTLSAMGVLLMGEGNEKVPIVIVRGADFVRFTRKNTYRRLVVSKEKDLYSPLLKVFQKK